MKVFIQHTSTEGAGSSSLRQALKGDGRGGRREACSLAWALRHQLACRAEGRPRRQRAPGAEDRGRRGAGRGQPDLCAPSPAPHIKDAPGGRGVRGVGGGRMIREGVKGEKGSGETPAQE